MKPLVLTDLLHVQPRGLQTATAVVLSYCHGTQLSLYLCHVAYRLWRPMRTTHKVSTSPFKHYVLLSACRHVVLPIITSAHSAEPAAVATSRQWALHVALVPSKPGGLCDHLTKQLCTLHDQWPAAGDVNRRAGQQVRWDMQSHGRVIADCQTGSSADWGLIILKFSFSAVLVPHSKSSSADV